MGQPIVRTASLFSSYQHEGVVCLMIITCYAFGAYVDEETVLMSFSETGCWHRSRRSTVTPTCLSSRSQAFCFSCMTLFKTTRRCVVVSPSFCVTPTMISRSTLAEVDRSPRLNPSCWSCASASWMSPNECDFLHIRWSKSVKITSLEDTQL